MQPRYGNIGDIAWFFNNSMNQPHEVGQKRPNGFGLFDVLGNVWEWVNDWYDPEYYQHSPSRDPAGPSHGQLRVMRGGSWSDGARVVRVSFRGRALPGRWDYFYGIRCGM
jgi:formylglycine-generating enzyme required for sulfatase activity